MEPRIQYAKTEDGVNIAYWTMGEGEPLVLVPMPIMSHAQLNLQRPDIRNLAERLAPRRKLIGYDSRAAGLSDRSITDYSLEGLVRDLEAVTGHLGLERFALWAQARAGLVAIAYAAQSPDRVSHLVLSNTAARDIWGSKALGATGALIEQDWELFTQTYMNFLGGWPEREIADQWVAYMQASTSPEAVLAFDAAFEDVDVTGLLGLVRVPTLVLCTRGGNVDLAAMRDLATGIPDASLAVEEGTLYTEASLRAIDEFLSEGEEAKARSDAPGGFATILFTDMESSTALTQRLGDAKAQELVRTHNTIVRDALKQHVGSEIKHTGDGIMASFTTASSALECAVAIQRAVDALRQAQGDQAGHESEAPLAVRIGLNAGEPVAEEDPGGRVDLFGTAVQLARRICDHAQPGEILASNVVRELAAGKNFLFADQGDVVPKRFEEAVRLYEVRWQES